MFGVGLPELLLILALLVVCFRPDQLARLARTAGQLGGQLWRISQGVRSELERELDGLESIELDEAGRSHPASSHSTGEMKPAAPPRSGEPRA